MRRALPPRLVAIASLAVALTSTIPACADGGAASRTLVDGSPAASPPVELEGVEEPVYLTTVRVIDDHALDRAGETTSCVVGEWGEHTAWPSVHRLGTNGESVTFLAATRRAVHSCDGTRRRGRSTPRWCGHALGRLTRGSLGDPRLELGACSLGAGQPVAFAWIEPDPRARYLVIHERGFAEVYESAAGLPVRVSTTTGVDVDRSRAVFAISEHSADGRVLRSYELEAYVSG